MADRRMMSRGFVGSDAFSDLSLDARLLYCYLNIYADDDGFIGQAKRIVRTEGINNNALPELIERGFLLEFPKNHVYLLAHWRVNNQIKADRHRATDYQSEFKQVELNSNKVYVMKQTPTCLQTVSKVETEIEQVNENKKVNEVKKVKEVSAGEAEGGSVNPLLSQIEQVFIKYGVRLTPAVWTVIQQAANRGIAHEEIINSVQASIEKTKGDYMALERSIKEALA